MHMADTRPLSLESFLVIQRHKKGRKELRLAYYL